MSTTLHRRPTALGRLLALAGILALGAAGWASAQQPNAASPPPPAGNQPQPVKIAPSANPPSSVAAERAQQPEFVGPPAPGAAVRPAAKPGSDVPQPTVVLKPGEVPAVQFDQPIWDFGRIPAGPEITHDFWFTNTGTGPLEILKVRPG